jgi:uncharacterized protein
MTEQVLFALLSGALVSFVLGLVGGGGSMLALPLLVHVVGVRSPHIAVGVSAAAVAVNALTNLGAHARQGTVQWRCAILFAASGALGAAVGAVIGKSVDGQALLALFGVLMTAVGLTMLRRPRSLGQPDVRLTARTAARLAPRLIALGFATGVASAFLKGTQNSGAGELQPARPGPGCRSRVEARDRTRLQDRRAAVNARDARKSCKALPWGRAPRLSDSG